MRYLSLILNLPWTILGLLAGVVSLPTKVRLNKTPFALVMNVQSFWWSFGWFGWLPEKKWVRAMNISHVILLGPLIQERDLEHELVHVEQFNRFPFIFPVLYYIETFKHGYRHNEYEEEAYSKSGSMYLEHDK